MDGSHRRRRLQRGAKDKAYAERIAAGQDVCKSSRPSGATSTNKNKLSTKPPRRQNKKRPRELIEKVATPQNWPFPSEDSLGNTSKKSNGPGTEKKGSRPRRSQRSRGSSHHAVEAKAPCLEQKRDDKAEVEADIEPIAAPRSMKMKSTRSTTRKQTDAHGKHSTRTIAASEATDFNGSWTCRRCTLLNGNRRKKCEVCGSPRTLSMDWDGKLSINENSEVGGVFSVGVAKEDGAEGGANIGSSDAQSCQAADIGSERQRHSQMSDIFDAPVGTRSRRRQTQSTDNIQNPAELEPFKADDGINSQRGRIEDSVPSPCGDTVIVRVRLAMNGASQSSHDGGGLFTSLPKIVLSKIAFRDMSGTSASERRDGKSIFAKVPPTIIDESDTMGNNKPFTGGDADEQNVTRLVGNLRKLVDVSGDFDEEDIKPVGENDLSSMIQECSTEASHSISFDLHKERRPSSGVAVGSGALENSERVTFEKRDSTSLQGCTTKWVGSDSNQDIGTTSLAVDEHGVCGVRHSLICEGEEGNQISSEAAGKHITHRSHASTGITPFIPMTQQAPDFDYMTQVG